MAELFLDDVALEYKDGKNETEICKSLSLTFSSGQVIGILGPNGSGKSTLVKSILGLHSFKAGAKKLNGFENSNYSISYIPQDIKQSFFTWASLRNNIRLTLPGFFKRWKSNGKKIDSIRSDFGLDMDLRIKPHMCSGGMLQQTAIIRAFASDPQVIIADEPFSALDIAISGKIRKTFRQKVIAQNVIGIIISHSLDDLLTTCDKVILIPNKPYSSLEESGYHIVKVLTNSHLSEYTSNGDITSLEKIALNLFDDEKASK